MKSIDDMHASSYKCYFIRLRLKSDLTHFSIFFNYYNANIIYFTLNIIVRNYSCVFQ